MPQKPGLQKRIIAKARELHCRESDDIQVDDHASIEETDDGVWVQAIVWVSNYAIANSEVPEE